MKKIKIEVTIPEAKVLVRLLVSALNMMHVFSGNVANYEMLHSLKEEIETEMLKT